MPTVEFLVEKKKIQIGMYANLKKAAAKNEVDLGSGVIEVVEGMQNLSPKGKLEDLLLKGRPANFRMAGLTEVLGDVCIITDFKPKPSRQ
jgi:hypothetical protein